MNDIEYSKYSDLAGHLFGQVSNNYKRTKQLTTFDFFCIVAWKANRAKSKIAATLKKAHGHSNLDKAVEALIKNVSDACDGKERLRTLIEDWELRLPTASAILSVLFPDEFTVYDTRVCGELEAFDDAHRRKPFDKLWHRYSEYVRAVRAAVSGKRTLREKDRYLWGRSFARQLERDICTSFRHKAKRQRAGYRDRADHSRLVRRIAEHEKSQSAR